ncbi:uncharacterized protein RAG0_12590 [Rhynchosporium agropyri]|uniref:Uncharacterized protein n=1 Tax=Rhynchosporium agropyri TaxID=914238 RepID=A0A1E1L915_9HELO|nr:uncharacterized protein RAG0_12590 [Rhynchosporium agropyri]
MIQISPTERHQHVCGVSPAAEFPPAESPPAYNSLHEDINFPAYHYGTLIGISDDIDAWITGRAPYCYLNSCEQVYLLTNTARRHRRKLSEVLSLIDTAKNVSSYYQRLRTVGLTSMSAAIVHDIVSPPYHLTHMVVALIRSKFERMKAEAGILAEVLESLWLSLEAAFGIITTLGLDTRETVERRVLNGEGYIFLAIARLLEAYGSRFAPSGTVFLASHKRLPKEHCFGTARLHFEQIHDLKEVLMFVNLFPAQDLDASGVLERCLRRIYPALKKPFTNWFSNEEPGFSLIVQRVRYVQDGMPGLISFNHRQ